MSWLDDLLGKRILRNDTILPDRKQMIFVQGAGATVDVEDTDDGTQVTISAGGPPVSPTVDQSPTVDDNGTRYYIGASAVVVNLPASSTVSVGYTLSIRNRGAALAKFKAQGTDKIQEMDGRQSAAAGYLQTSLSGFATLEWEGTVWLVTDEGGQGWDLA